MLVNNPPISLDRIKFDYICDININKNGNAVQKKSWRGLSKRTHSITTHGNNKFCKFMIPPLDWPLEKLSGIYIIVHTPTETVFYVGQTNNLPQRFIGPWGYGQINQRKKSPHSAKINKKIYAEIEAGNLLQIYFHSNVPVKSKRKGIEAALIRSFNPSWNTQHRSDGSSTHTDSAGAVIEDSDELDEYGLYKKAWDIDEEEPEV